MPVRLRVIEPFSIPVWINSWVYSFLSVKWVVVHHGDTEDTEDARRFEI
jgi:hypothetical protein